MKAAKPSSPEYKVLAPCLLHSQLPVQVCHSGWQVTTTQFMGRKHGGLGVRRGLEPPPLSSASLSYPSVAWETLLRDILPYQQVGRRSTGCVWRGGAHFLPSVDPGSPRGGKGHQRTWPPVLLSAPRAGLIPAAPPSTRT